MNDNKLPCINNRTCGGYAEPGRAKCWCCIEADENVKAAKIERQLEHLEEKPRSWRDMWGGRSKR